MPELKVLTIKGLAEEIVNRIDTEHILKERFPACDYGVIDVEGETEFDQEELEFLRSGICGWYGIHPVDTGFDSEDLVLVADYYGGGSARLVQLFDGIDKAGAATDICRTIVDSMKFQEEADENTTLLVEFLDPK